MTDIFTTLKRLHRLPRPHRIAFLRSLVQLAPPRSIRRVELESALKREVTAQLKREARAA
jgi:hypothetical protein